MMMAILQKRAQRTPDQWEQEIGLQGEGEGLEEAEGGLSAAVGLVTVTAIGVQKPKQGQDHDHIP
jgi:hypothetical protein